MSDKSPPPLLLPSLPPFIASDTPPRGHRSDTVGIFAVLAISGLADMLVSKPDSVNDLVGNRVAFAWGLTMVVFGLLGLASTLLPKRLLIPALGMELAARIALAFSASTYATAILLDRGLTAGTALAACVFYGIAMMFAFAAAQIARWLVRQRMAVTAVMENNGETA